MSHLDGVRAYLDGWGSALDDQRLVEAVITAGVVQANPWLRKARMAREVRDFLEDALYAVDWRPPDDLLSMIDADMAAGAVAACATLPTISAKAERSRITTNRCFRLAKRFSEHPAPQDVRSRRRRVR